MIRSEPDWSTVTAVFGGTFDPPHLGHIEAMSGVLTHPGVKRIRAVPAGNPPLKSTLTPAEHRLRMLELLVEGAGRSLRERIVIDDREIRRTTGMNSGRPSYTAETLEELAREDGAIAFVIGTDQLKDLPRWHRFPEILGLSHWIVLKRQPEDAELIRSALAPLLQSNLITAAGPEGTFRIARSPSSSLPGNCTMKLVSTPAPAVSSTEIRREFALRGEAPAGSLSMGVDRYLKEKRLYGTQSRNDDKP